MATWRLGTVWSGQTGRGKGEVWDCRGVRPFGGWAWKSPPPPLLVIFILSCSPPLPPFLPPLPIHISCPFLRRRGWMGAPSHPRVSPTQGLATPVLPIDLPASPTCAPATEETKDCFLPNRNSKLRSCAKLAPAPTDEFPAQRGCVAEMGRDEED